MLVGRERARIAVANDRLLVWLAEHVLTSIVVFDAALLLPLAVLPMGAAAKVALGLISSNWFQWWALPALQRLSLRAAQTQEAVMEAQHCALTHLAHRLDTLTRVRRVAGSRRH